MVPGLIDHETQVSRADVQAEQHGHPGDVLSEGNGSWAGAAGDCSDAFEARL